MSEKTSLNGGQTRPLSVAAISALTSLCREPVPCQEVNPDIVVRLTREDLARIESLPSPYKAHQGPRVKRIPHLVIADAGRQRIRDLEKPL